jgi:hypothetical protein
LQKSALSLRGDVLVRGFNAQYVRTFQDSLSARKARQGLIYEDKGRNLIVNNGSNLIAQLCTGSSTAYFTYCAVGSGTNAVTAGDSTLQTELGRVAVIAAYAVSNMAHFDTFFSIGQGNGTWNETGIFNASSNGTMGSRKLLSSSFSKSGANTATVSWSWTFTPQ